MTRLRTSRVQLSKLKEVAAADWNKQSNTQEFCTNQMNDILAPSTFYCAPLKTSVPISVPGCCCSSCNRCHLHCGLPGTWSVYPNRFINRDYRLLRRVTTLLFCYTMYQTDFIMPVQDPAALESLKSDFFQFINENYDVELSELRRPSLDFIAKPLVVRWMSNWRLNWHWFIEEHTSHCDKQWCTHFPQGDNGSLLARYLSNVLVLVGYFVLLNVDVTTEKSSGLSPLQSSSLDISTNMGWYTVISIMTSIDIHSSLELLYGI